MGNNSTFADSIEASALNNLRDASGLDTYGNGKFKSNPYINARKDMDAKAGVLMPKSAEVTQRLANVSRNINEQPEGSYVNNSASAIVGKRMQMQEEAAKAKSSLGGPAMNLGASALAAKLGPIGGAAKTMGEMFLRDQAAKKAAIKVAAEKEAIAAEKLKYANEVTATGAGLNYKR
jgi:hypothetical protein